MVYTQPGQQKPRLKQEGTLNAVGQRNEKMLKNEGRPINIRITLSKAIQLHEINDISSILHAAL